MSSFSAVLCGFDGSDEGEEGLRQAVTIVNPNGTLLVTTVAHTGLAHRTGWDAPRALHDLRTEAERTRARAARPGRHRAL